jgi:putative endonuclease
MHFVYIVTNKPNGILYIGVTNDLVRRINEHKQGNIEGFSSKYKTNKLIYFEEFEYICDAIEREKQLKHWNRSWKIELIESKNAKWNDLFVDLY